MILILKKIVSWDPKTPLILISLLTSCLIVLHSCVPWTSSQKRLETTIYRSENYVIYKLQEPETPESLAKRFLGDEKKSWKIEEANPEKRFSIGQYIIIPLREKNKGGVSRDGYQVVPILTYHRFAKECNSVLCIPTDIFAKQMEYLKNNGYHVITSDDLFAFLDYREALPKKTVMITVDDGFRSVYDIAFPIMKKYGFTATLFVYTDYVGISKSAITWDQLREMKEEGFSIGSHTVAHSDLTKIGDDESEQDFLSRIIRELRDSKKIIDKKLGQDTFMIAYPFGNSDQRVIEYSKQAGYKIGLTVERGGNAFFNNPMSLRRDQVLSEDIKEFQSLLVTMNRFSLE